MNDSIYLKDFHLQRELADMKNPPHPVEFYTTPKFFESDFLNEYASLTGTDDYKFVYVGNQKTWTPFHKDVLSSFSWSVNIAGLKKWIFIREGAEKQHLDHHSDYVKFHNLGEFYPRDVTPYLKNSEENVIFAENHVSEIFQKSGNAIFVPSNTFHQVENLEPTVSINHNWINGCNLSKVKHHLQEELQKVETSIEEHKDSMENFEEHCQMMLKSLTGMNFESYNQLLQTILKVRLARLGIENKNPDEILNNFKLCGDFNACNLPLDFRNSDKLHDQFDVIQILNNFL